MTIDVGSLAAFTETSAAEEEALATAAAAGAYDFAVPDYATSVGAENARNVRFDGQVPHNRDAQIFRRLETNVPGISKGIDNLIAAATADIGSFAAAAAGRLPDIVRARHLPPRQLHSTTAWALGKVTNRLWRSIHVDMPTLYNRVTTEDITRLTFVADVLNKSIQTVQSWAAQTFTSVIDDYTSKISGLTNWAVSTFNIVIGDYSSRIAAEQNRAVASENDIVTWAAAAIGTEEQRAVAAEHDILTYAAQAITAEEQRAVTAEHDIVTWAGDAIKTTAAETIAYTDTEVAAPVAGRYMELQQSQNTMLSDLELLAPAALAGLSALPALAPQTARAAAVATLTKLETCEEWINAAGSPVLKQLGPFPKDLSALLGLLELGAILAFVGAAVADPEGTAQVMVDVFEPVATGIGETIDAVVGIVADL